MDGISHIDIERIANQIPVTITTEPGMKPVINATTINTANNFVIACLNITTLVPSTSADGINLVSNSFFGELSDITILNNTVSNFIHLIDNDYKLMNSQGGDGIVTSGTRVRIIGNYIFNVRRGITASATYGYYAHNHINYVFGDAFRVVNNHTWVEYNLAENSMNVDNGTDHRDGCQMFTNGDRFSLINITISRNRFLADTDIKRPYRDFFQGIDGFDVPLYDAVVANNLVVSQTYHGVSLYSSANALVIGNTMLDATGQLPVWISFAHKDGNFVSINSTVINNIMAAQEDWTSVTLQAGNVVHKFNTTELAMYFDSDWRPKNVPGSPAGLGNGSTIEHYWSLYDITGQKRALPYDVGCYNLAYDLSDNTNGSAFATVCAYLLFVVALIHML
eukprot:Phypoly_transcript_09092.p1 GENE.Phypoly_transcript_09092~~Phypoly_transcript_09092.p1  ORF type:complete len:393 (+),score=58.42 Phypoly_transcript_09092:160-1338(+)